MFNSVTKAACFAAACALAPTAHAATVTFDIEIAGVTGMFDAPEEGGLLSSFNITLGGVTFDTLGMGVSAPVYNAVDNDIRGNGSTEASILNSVAGPGCAALSCILSLEDSVDPGVVPPLYAIFPLEGGIPGTVTSAGEYAITGPAPIPLPAPLALLLGAILSLLGLRKMRDWGRNFTSGGQAANTT
ncbi:MAG: hypothetical protein AAFN80_03665 [Pseudomonadota bacterium]